MQQPPPNKIQRGKRSWFWRVQVSWGQSFGTGSSLIFFFIFVFIYLFVFVRRRLEL